MIVPDINLLVHAYRTDSADHIAARQWWEDRLNGSKPIGLPWAVVLGFLRVTTNRHVFTNPLLPSVACGHVRQWLAEPIVSLLHPGERHPEILFQLLESIGTAGNLTMDAHLAALAIEHQSEVHSTDADFSRFPGLRWTNPLRAT